MVRVIMEFVWLSRQGSLPPLVQGQPLPQRSPCFHDQFGILRREPDQVTARPPLAPVTVASNALVELTPLPELQESPAAFQLPHDPALSLLYVPGRYSRCSCLRPLRPQSPPMPWLELRPLPLRRPNVQKDKPVCPLLRSTNATWTTSWPHFLPCGRLATISGLTNSIANRTVLEGQRSRGVL